MIRLSVIFVFCLFLSSCGTYQSAVETIAIGEEMVVIEDEVLLSLEQNKRDLETLKDFIDWTNPNHTKAFDQLSGTHNQTVKIIALWIVKGEEIKYNHYAEKIQTVKLGIEELEQRIAIVQNYDGIPYSIIKMFLDEAGRQFFRKEYAKFFQSKFLIS